MRSRTTRIVIDDVIDIRSAIIDKEHLHDANDVKIKIWVEIPSGGDWSDTRLDLLEYPIKYEVSYMSSRS